MSEPTEPGELSDAALDRALERRRRPTPLDTNEIDHVRHLLKHSENIDWVSLLEVIDQWTYDKRRAAEESRNKTDVRAKLPWISFAFTVISAVGGWVAGWVLQKPGGGH